MILKFHIQNYLDKSKKWHTWHSPAANCYTGGFHDIIHLVMQWTEQDFEDGGRFVFDIGFDPSNSFLEVSHELISYLC